MLSMCLGFHVNVAPGWIGPEDTGWRSKSTDAGFDERLTHVTAFPMTLTSTRGRKPASVMTIVCPKSKCGSIELVAGSADDGCGACPVAEPADEHPARIVTAIRQAPASLGIASPEGLGRGSRTRATGASGSPALRGDTSRARA